MKASIAQLPPGESRLHWAGAGRRGDRSGSGLDPEISPANADVQATRVARARNLQPDQVRGVIAEIAEGRWLAFIGEPRVNVLKLNLALDERFGRIKH